MGSEERGPLDSFAPGLFAGQTAVITGGGRGIGESAALGFARLGANVVIAARTRSELDAVAGKIADLGGECLVCETNIRDLVSVDALRDACLERFGAADFLINNAGGQFMADPFRISDNAWRSVVDLNLNGTWNVTSRFMRPMMARGFGRIVNVVHIYSFERGAPLFAHSGAARAGVVNLTRSLAPHLDPRNVTINAVAPGTTISPAAAANYGWTEAEWRQKMEPNRCAEPDDVAATLIFLCSPGARMINGAVLTVDAASTQQNWPQGIMDDIFESSRAVFE